MTFSIDFEFHREEFLNLGREIFMEEVILDSIEHETEGLVKDAMIQELISIDREEWESVNSAIPFTISPVEVDEDDLSMINRRVAKKIFTAWVHTLHHHLSKFDKVSLDMEYMPIRDLYTFNRFRKLHVAGQEIDLTKQFLSAIASLLDKDKPLLLPVYMVLQRGRGGYYVTRRNCHGEDFSVSPSG